MSVNNATQIKKSNYPTARTQNWIKTFKERKILKPHILTHTHSQVCGLHTLDVCRVRGAQTLL